LERGPGFFGGLEVHFVCERNPKGPAENQVSVIHPRNIRFTGGTIDTRSVGLLLLRPILFGASGNTGHLQCAQPSDYCALILYETVAGIQFSFMIKISILFSEVFLFSYETK
jgi:hypothetical protein